MKRTVAMFFCIVAMSSAVHAEIPSVIRRATNSSSLTERTWSATARTSSPSGRDDRGGPTVRGTLITRRGEIRNPFGIVIGKAEYNPRVLWSGTSYLVFWTPSGRHRVAEDRRRHGRIFEDRHQRQ